MAKSIQIVLVVALLSVCSASPAKLDKLRLSKSKFLARQEVAEDILPAQTPYPPAGIRPEVAFNLPTEEKPEEPAVNLSTEEEIAAPADHYLPPVVEPAKFLAPAEVYGPPAETYGPPEVSRKNGEDEEENAQSEEVQPEEVQPTESSQQPEEEAAEEEEEVSPKDEVETEPEQEIVEVEPVEVNNELGRLVLSKNKNSAKLRSSKLLVQPAQRFFLIDGKLYSLKA